MKALRFDRDECRQPHIVILWTPGGRQLLIDPTEMGCDRYRPIVTPGVLRSWIEKERP